jgi:hypothetical protein
MMARDLTTPERRELLRHSAVSCEVRLMLTPPVMPCDACGSSLALCDCPDAASSLEELLEVVGCECSWRVVPLRRGQGNPMGVGGRELAR